MGLRLVAAFVLYIQFCMLVLSPMIHGGVLEGYCSGVCVLLLCHIKIFAHCSIFRTAITLSWSCLCLYSGSDHALRGKVWFSSSHWDYEWQCSTQMRETFFSSFTCSRTEQYIVKQDKSVSTMLRGTHLLRGTMFWHWVLLHQSQWTIATHEQPSMRIHIHNHSYILCTLMDIILQAPANDGNLP